MADNQLQRIMENLDCDEETARQVMADDKAIDRGERMPFDLSPEQEKLAKKYANVTEHKKPTVYKFDTRKRKENTTKKEIIAEIVTFLKEKGYENIEILNAERQIGFSVAEKQFELTLVEKRKPKK